MSAEFDVVKLHVTEAGSHLQHAYRVAAVRGDVEVCAAVTAAMVRLSEIKAMINARGRGEIL
jgi:hypothetical protein